MADLTRLVRKLVREAVGHALAEVPARRQVIVTAVTGTGAARRATCKFDADDPDPFDAACARSYTPGSLPEAAYIDVMPGGDVVVVFAVG